MGTDKTIIQPEEFCALPQAESLDAEARTALVIGFLIAVFGLATRGYLMVARKAREGLRSVAIDLASPSWQRDAEKYLKKYSAQENTYFGVGLQTGIPERGSR